MLVPRYYFADDYTQFYNYFLSQPHTEKIFHKDEFLWNTGEYIERVYYIISGIVQTNVEHEDGYQKIMHFHGKGTVFPGCQNSAFKIEKSITAKALSDVHVLEFTRKDFYHMFQENKELNAQVFETYAMYINLFLYETAHQEYNNSFIKLCNLLYLFSVNSPEKEKNQIKLTQENISEILTLNRVNTAKNLTRLREENIIISHRKWIEIIDTEALKKYCSYETLDI